MRAAFEVSHRYEDFRLRDSACSTMSMDRFGFIGGHVVSPVERVVRRHYMSLRFEGPDKIPTRNRYGWEKLSW